MAVELRPLTAVVVLIAVLSAGTLGSVVVTETVGEEYDPATEAVSLEEDDRGLWLYTSQARSFDEWTLAINVVVYGDPDDVERHLRERGQGNWEETDDDEQDIAPDETVEAGGERTVRWEPADGSQRYVYLTGPRGMWLGEAYQLHDGDYLGSRHHIRAYTPPDDDGEWTAMQAHYEHWDWFSARHVVTSVEESQAHIEQEFIGNPNSHEVVRTHVGGEDRSDFDGWVTIVTPGDAQIQPALVAVVLGLIGASASRRSSITDTFQEISPQQEARTLVLAVGIVALLLGVRLTAIGLERSLPIPPKSVAVLFYPVLFVGLPIVTYLLARHLDRAWAFGGASLGFLTAVLVDYTYLGVTTLPVDTLVHRGAMAVALGLIAAGASRTERRDSGEVNHVQVGVLLWLVATLLPLLRFTPLPV